MVRGTEAVPLTLRRRGDWSPTRVSSAPAWLTADALVAVIVAWQLVHALIRLVIRSLPPSLTSR